MKVQLAPQAYLSDKNVMRCSHCAALVHVNDHEQHVERCRQLTIIIELHNR